MASLCVAAITAIIFPLRTVSPAVSNGVLYLLAVLLVSTVWGLWLGLLTSVASAAAFTSSTSRRPGASPSPTGRNCVALAVFFVAAVVAGSVADLARARATEAELRRREADVAADLARLLLGGASVEQALAPAAARLADALDLPWAAIELGTATHRHHARELALVADGRRLGTLLVPVGLADELAEQVRERVAPALQALLFAALERDRLQAEVVETQALRRRQRSCGPCRTTCDPP